MRKSPFCGCSSGDDFFSKPSQSCKCGLEGKWFAERIVRSSRDEVCFDGTLCVEGLPCSFCLPLTLRHVAAADIKTVCRDQCGERLRLTLLCVVCDARGCSAEGTACVELVIDDARRCCCFVGSVYRGAEIRISSARSCQGCCFEVCLDVCVQTIETQCELIGGKAPGEACCPQLPLYPQMPKLLRERERYAHFFR